MAGRPGDGSDDTSRKPEEKPDAVDNLAQTVGDFKIEDWRWKPPQADDQKMHAFGTGDMEVITRDPSDKGTARTYSYVDDRVRGAVDKVTQTDQSGPRTDGDKGSPPADKTRTDSNTSPLPGRIVPIDTPKSQTEDEKARTADIKARQQAESDFKEGKRSTSDDTLNPQYVGSFPNTWQPAQKARDGADRLGAGGQQATINGGDRTITPAPTGGNSQMSATFAAFEATRTGTGGDRSRSQEIIKPATPNDGRSTAVQPPANDVSVPAREIPTAPMPHTPQTDVTSADAKAKPATDITPGSTISATVGQVAPGMIPPSAVTSVVDSAGRQAQEGINQASGSPLNPFTPPVKPDRPVTPDGKDTGSRQNTTPQRIEQPTNTTLPTPERPRQERTGDTTARGDNPTSAAPVSKTDGIPADKRGDTTTKGKDNLGTTTTGDGRTSSPDAKAPGRTDAASPNRGDARPPTPAGITDANRTTSRDAQANKGDGSTPPTSRDGNRPTTAREAAPTRGDGTLAKPAAPTGVGDTPGRSQNAARPETAPPPKEIPGQMQRGANPDAAGRSLANAKTDATTARADAPGPRAAGPTGGSDLAQGATKGGDGTKGGAAASDGRGPRGDDPRGTAAGADGRATGATKGGDGGPKGPTGGSDLAHGQGGGKGDGTGPRGTSGIDARDPSAKGTEGGKAAAAGDGRTPGTKGEAGSGPTGGSDLAHGQGGGKGEGVGTKGATGGDARDPGAKGSDVGGKGSGADGRVPGTKGGEAGSGPTGGSDLAHGERGGKGEVGTGKGEVGTGKGDILGPDGKPITKGGEAGGKADGALAGRGDIIDKSGKFDANPGRGGGGSDMVAHSTKGDGVAGGAQGDKSGKGFDLRDWLAGKDGKLGDGVKDTGVKDSGIRDGKGVMADGKVVGGDKGRVSDVPFVTLPGMPDLGRGGKDSGVRDVAARDVKDSGVRDAVVKDGPSIKESGVRDGSSVKESGVRDASSIKESGVRDASSIKESGVRDGSSIKGPSVKDSGVRDPGSIRSEGGLAVPSLPGLELGSRPGGKPGDHGDGSSKPAEPGKTPDKIDPTGKTSGVLEITPQAIKPIPTDSIPGLLGASQNPLGKTELGPNAKADSETAKPGEIKDGAKLTEKDPTKSPERLNEKPASSKLNDQIARNIDQLSDKRSILPEIELNDFFAFSNEDDFNAAPKLAKEQPTEVTSDQQVQSLEAASADHQSEQVLARDSVDNLDQADGRNAYSQSSSYVVAPGETLEHIASKLFQDRMMALLLLEINRDRIPTTLMDGERVLDLRAGMQLELPTVGQVKEFNERMAMGLASIFKYAGPSQTPEEELANWEAARKNQND